MGPEEISGVDPDFPFEVFVGKRAQLFAVDVPVGEVDRGSDREKHNKKLNEETKDQKINPIRI